MDHEAGAGVEPAVGEDVVEGEVVEHLDQLRVGDDEGGAVVGEELVVVAAGGLADCVKDASSGSAL